MTVISTNNAYDRSVLLIRQVWRSYTTLKEVIPGVGAAQLRLDPLIVARAVDNALADIERWEKFHQKDSSSAASVPDNHKFSGFVARWVAKEKPIQICLPIAQDRQSAISVAHWANPMLAVFVYQAFLDKPIPAHLAPYLRYWFAFREERGDTLAFIAYLIEQIKH